MSGVAWAAVAGVLFGIFQSVNRATLVEMDVYASTFLQLLVCSAFMVIVLVLDDAGAVRRLSATAIANFSIAGLIHFMAGWTLLNMSQKRLGASRTSPLIATTPLFATAVAAVALDEVPDSIEVVGMVLIVIGVYVAQMDRARTAPAQSTVGGRIGQPSLPVASDAPPFWWSVFGLGAALAWAVSPIFIRHGLEEVDEPILGVTVGVVAASLAFGIALLVRGRSASLLAASRSSLAWKAVAGILVGVATWARWYALSLTTVVVVLSLALLSVPTVLLLAPIVAGRHLERITVPVVIGSAFVVGGSLVLIAQG